MARKSSHDRLLMLRERRDQLDAQLRNLEARRKEAERKADTRRKVIAGALALEHFEANRDSEFAKVLFRLMDEYVVRPHDRVLFPFLPSVTQRAPELGVSKTDDLFTEAARETFGQREELSAKYGKGQFTPLWQQRSGRRFPQSVHIHNAGRQYARNALPVPLHPARKRRHRSPSCLGGHAPTSAGPA